MKEIRIINRDPVPTISWESLDRHPHVKGHDWYWGLGIIALTAIILAIIAHNYLLAVLVALATFITVIYAKKEPAPITYSITDRGIKAHSTLYPFDNIQAFWIHENNENVHLFLVLNRGLLPVVTIPVNEGTIDRKTLRNILVRVLPEQETSEPLTHRIVQYLKI